MTDDDFVLDRVENPHPRMLAEALTARAAFGFDQAPGSPVAASPRWRQRG